MADAATMPYHQLGLKQFHQGDRMTRPVHTVKYMQTRYRKYQILAIVCTLVTVAAAILTALSGIQVNALKKNEVQTKKDVAASYEQEAISAKMELNKMKKTLAETQQLLTLEKQKSDNLLQKVSVLQLKIDAIEAAVSAPAQQADNLKPAPERPAQPQEQIFVPDEPQSPESEPPPPPQPQSRLTDDAPAQQSVQPSSAMAAPGTDAPATIDSQRGDDAASPAPAVTTGSTAQ